MSNAQRWFWKKEMIGEKMKESGMSRRNFITGTALAGVGIAAGLTACSNSTKPENSGKKDMDFNILPDAWSDEADVIVVGYGGSGVNAAISALKNGASVIALEKAPDRIGGNMGQSQGTLHDCPDANVDEWLKCYKHGAFQTGLEDAEIRAFMEEAVKIPKWLEEYGMKINWVELKHELGKSWPVYQLEGHIERGLGAGFDLFLGFDEIASNLDVDVRCSTRANRLIQNPVTKEILGVEAEDTNTGKTFYFKAKKGVVMSIGGYERNREMLYNHVLPGIDLIGGGGSNIYNTGDGFPMVLEAGAKLWHMTSIHTSSVGLRRPWQEGVEDGVGNMFRENLGRGPGGRKREVPWPYIFIGWHGHRFMNENYQFAHDANHKAAFDYSSQDAFVKTWPGAQDPMVLRYTDITTDYVNMPFFVVFDSHMYKENDPIFPATFKSNQEAVNAGWIMKGETWDELAKNIYGKRPCNEEWDMVKGINAEALKKTIATYNGYAKNKKDPEFGRYDFSLKAFSETGPYYAMELQWGLDFTEGGPMRNGKCQTIGHNGKPIPRLYSTGEFGSYNSTAYTIGGLVQACTTGRIAGREAAGLEAWDM